jgi:hypothetical protein
MEKLTLFFLGVCAMTIGLVTIQAIDPRGILAGLLFGGCGSLALFITGPFWLVKKFIANVQAEVPAVVDPAMVKSLAEKTDAEIVDLIDNSVNKFPVVANHPWLAQHWHKLSAGDKTKWVCGRRTYLNTTLSAASVPIHFVPALQQADKEFYRKAS